MKPSKKNKIYFLKTIARIADVLHLSKKFISDTPQRCLIISTTGIGDTLWGTPAISALKEKMPSVYLSVITNTNGEEILRQNQFIDNFFIFKKRFFNNWRQQRKEISAEDRR